MDAWSDVAKARGASPERTWRFVAEVEEDQVVPALEMLHALREAGQLK